MRLRKNLPVPEVATWLFMGMIMLAMIFSSSGGTEEEQKRYQGDHYAELVNELVREHPDPMISKDLHELRVHGRLVMGLAELHGGEVMFALKDQDFVEAAYGFRPDVNPVPVLLLDREAMIRANGSDRNKRLLMSNLRHEYEHVLQWQKGSFFHDGSNTVVLDCHELWAREFHVFRDDCRRAQEWWPGEQVLQEHWCEYVDDPKKFGEKLTQLLARVDSSCVPIWEQALAQL